MQLCLITSGFQRNDILQNTNLGLIFLTFSFGMLIEGYCKVTIQRFCGPSSFSPKCSSNKPQGNIKTKKLILAQYTPTILCSFYLVWIHKTSTNIMIQNNHHEVLSCTIRLDTVVSKLIKSGKTLDNKTCSLSTQTQSTS